jgi:hypothetical protein
MESLNNLLINTVVDIVTRLKAKYPVKSFISRLVSPGFERRAWTATVMIHYYSQHTLSHLTLVMEKGPSRRLATGISQFRDRSARQWEQTDNLLRQATSALEMSAGTRT